jgi:hypothetical protein
MPWKGSECGKNKVMIICTDYDISKATGNVKYLNYLGSVATNDAICVPEIKSRIAMANAAFSKKKTLYTSKLDVNLRKKLVQCSIWSVTLYGHETLPLREVDHKYLESFEMW